MIEQLTEQERKYILFKLDQHAWDTWEVKTIRRLLAEVELLKQQGIKAVDEIINHKYELMRKEIEIERLRKALKGGTE